MVQEINAKNDVFLPDMINLKDEIKGELLFESAYDLAEGRLAAAVSREGDIYRVILITDISGTLILHWGIAVHSPFEWLLPPASMHPEGTIALEGSAAQDRQYGWHVPA